MIKEKAPHLRGFCYMLLWRKLYNYYPNLSETENMHNHGFYKIYDAGKLRFVKGS